MTCARQVHGTGNICDSSHWHGQVWVIYLECFIVKVGSLTTYSACASPHYGHIRSTCGEVTNIPTPEDFSSQKSENVAQSLPKR